MSLSSSQLLAHALAGSWRPALPLLHLDASQWETLAPLLIGSGAGALGWRVARTGETISTAAQNALREIHHAQALQALFQEREIAATFARLHERGVEAILLKGWSCARRYPEAGLRPLGDIDILVRPEHKTLAGEVLGVVIDDETQLYQVDAKSKLRPIYGFDAEQVWQARVTVNLHGAPVSLLCEEDQLRMLCLHFLRHGAWRPLWLCDIAVALENRSPAFDWARCLGRDRRRKDAVACALGLAHHLLNAHIDDTPIAKRARALPAWLLPTVLRQWETPLVEQHFPPPLMMQSLRTGAAREAIIKRWPNPIEAVITMRTPLNWPPLPAQMLYFAAISGRFFQRAPALSSRKSHAAS